MQILLLANKFGAGLELRFLNSKCVDSDVRAPCSGASKQKLLLRYILTVSVFRSEPLALSLAGLCTSDNAKWRAARWPNEI